MRDLLPGCALPSVHIVGSLTSKLPSIIIKVMYAAQLLQVTTSTSSAALDEYPWVVDGCVICFIFEPKQVKA